MDVREKLVELLTEFYGCDPMYYDVDALAIAQHLITNGVTVQEWVSVDDRLPECEGSYIVYTERGSIYASHFYTEKRFASGYIREAKWSQRGTVKVTHWMPLPDTQKEVTCNEEV